MKTILLLLLSVISFAAYSQSWEQIDDYSGSARDDGASFKINNKVYCGTGRNAGFNVTSDFKAFDLSNETWSSIASMPDSVKRQYATSFVYSEKGYVFGGINSAGDYMNDLWMYSPVLDQWSFISNLPSTGRSGMSSFVNGTKAYIVGGKTELSIASKELWEFDLISSQWTQLNDIPSDGLWRGVSFTYDSTAFIGLGKNENNLINDSFYHYLPTSDQWQVVPQLVTNPRYYVGCSQIGDSVYLYGGVDSTGSYSNSFERINIASLAIDVLNSFPSDARKGVMAFTSNNDFYITTGISTIARLNETWVARNVVALEDVNLIKAEVYQSGNNIVVLSEVDFEAFRLVAMDGRVLISTIMEFDTVIDVSDMESGVYLYHLIGSDGREVSGRIFLNYEL